MPLWYLKNNGKRICPPRRWSRSGLSGTRSNGIRPEMLCRNEVEVVDRPNPRFLCEPSEGGNSCRKPRCRRPWSGPLTFLDKENMVKSGSNFRKLLRNGLAALLLCAVLVLLCALFVDRPVAYSVHDQRFADHLILKWLTYPPDILQACVPVVLAALLVRRVRGPLRRWERVALAACLGLILAEQCKIILAYAFGRYWPETWINDNPSLIRQGAYGFHPFRIGAAYASFPSGHTARTLAVASVIWTAYPRWRWACILMSLAVASGLVLMDYHFVGDVIAGGFVGAIAGTSMILCIDTWKEKSCMQSVPKPPGEKG